MSLNAPDISSNPTPSVWVLLDDRAGNNNQARGLADAIGFPKELVQIHYNLLAKLPNWLKGASLVGVDKAYTAALEPPYPDIVIAAGRKLAPVARFIKKQNPHTKLIHIMRPEMSSADFQHIILPHHDVISSELEASGKVIRTIGALNILTDDKLTNEARIWAPHLPHAPAPRIALLIGGNTKTKVMDASTIKQLITDAIALAKAQNASLLISTSRRTPPTCIQVIKDNIERSNVPHHLHIYGASPSNPYLAYLALAERIIVTGESVSMCSEAAFTGKPIYISSNMMMSPKHHRYIEDLYAHNHAKPLSEAMDGNWENAQKLDETARVAALIKKI